MIPLSLGEIAAITGGVPGPGSAPPRGDDPPSTPRRTLLAPGGTTPLQPPGQASSAATATVVTGPVVIDSRRAVPGALFAALPGEHADGHEFAAAAVAAGAVAVLAARPLPGLPAIVVDDVTAALGALARAVAAGCPASRSSASPGRRARPPPRISPPSWPNGSAPPSPPKAPSTTRSACR